MDSTPDDADERRALLARAWDEAAPRYEQYFVPRFTPWVASAVATIAGATLPAGPILVPCCGTFPELPALRNSHPRREIIGIDLSPEMVRWARQRATGLPRVRVVVGDATTLRPQWTNVAAGIVSVFGLQQLPDPASALADWIGTVRPGGRLSVMFWPSESETDGPFALLRRLLAGRRPPPDDAWQNRLGEVITAAGATVEREEYLTYPMHHPDAATFWTAITDGGSLRALSIMRGKTFMRALRQEFLDLAPPEPWHHSPRAQWIVAQR
ncbi:class I SAM-dependent methyltransferase [Kibdelosporangium phytohabitans]|uniref:Methyltransferase type 11 n=1 Tax=Kibdelosporangium phytohabitans TaxID=860235 RepID=A0A0N9IIA9_9PSEU|nr:class I SAM-dependent methyltransferase [Kibdelosporangium phytohabitans]ALG15147.1 methyltransferase type 11 [Kibdelosporangium phytohabitans]MBE1461501.1 SAM-dependent methyltransferase [Kibdelosporangium phytohabitans]